MSGEQMSQDAIVQRFNAMRWHDTKLLGLSFYRTIEDEEEVKISLSFLGNNGWQAPSDLIFRESTLIDMQLDLEGKSVCSDSIASAFCSVSSDWIKTLSEQNPHDNFEGYLHFKISMIPPGGVINILGKDFTFRTAPTP